MKLSTAPAAKNLKLTFATATVFGSILVGSPLIGGCSMGLQNVGLQDMPVINFTNKTISITADLATADGLVSGADVRDGQQIVGRVSAIELRNGHAQITLTVNEKTTLPANVEASVELPSALGTPFIRLSSPTNALSDSPDDSHGILADGAHLPLTKTSVGPQVESTLAALGTLFSGSGMSQLQSVMSSLNTAFAHRSQKVGDLIDTLNRLLSHSSVYTRDFNAAISSAARVSDLLVAQEKLITDFMDTVPQAVNVLALQRDRISSIMNQTSTLAKNMSDISSGRRPELNALVGDAEIVVKALATFNSRVGATLTNMNGFMTNFSRAIRGDYMVFDGALDIPGGIDKILTGGLLLSGQPLPIPKDLNDALTGGLASESTKKKPVIKSVPSNGAGR